MSSFINRNTNVFDEVSDEVLLRRRSEGRLKEYESALDSRAWTDNNEDRRQYILDVIRRGYSKTSSLPVEEIIQFLTNEKGDCKKLELENAKLRRLLESRAILPSNTKPPPAEPPVQPKPKPKPTPKRLSKNTFKDVNILGKVSVATSTSSLVKEAEPAKEGPSKDSSTTRVILKTSNRVSEDSIPAIIAEATSRNTLSGLSGLGTSNIMEPLNTMHEQKSSDFVRSHSLEKKASPTTRHSLKNSIQEANSKSGHIKKMLELETELSLKRKDTKERVDHLKSAFEKLKKELELEKSKNCTLTCQTEEYSKSMGVLQSDVASIKLQNISDKKKIQELCELLKNFIQDRQSYPKCCCKKESNMEQDLSGTCLMHSQTTKQLEKQLSECKAKLANKEKSYENLVGKYQESEQNKSRIEELVNKTMLSKEDLQQKLSETRQSLNETVEKLKDCQRMSLDKKRLSETVQRMGIELDVAKSQNEMDTEKMKNELIKLSSTVEVLEEKKKSLEEANRSIKKMSIEIQKKVSMENEMLIQIREQLEAELKRKIEESEKAGEMKGDLEKCSSAVKKLEEEKIRLEEENKTLKKLTMDIQESAKEQIEQCQSEKNMLTKRSRQFEQENEELKKTQDTSKHSLSKLKIKLIMNKSDLDNEKKLMEETQEKLKSLQDKVQRVSPSGDFTEFLRQREEIIRLHAEIERANAEKDNLKKLHDEDLENFKKTIAQMELDKDDAASIHQTNSFVENKIRTLEVTIEKLLRDMQEKGQSHVKQLSSLEEENGYLENKIKTCEETNGKLLRDMQDLKDHHITQLSSLQEENGSLKNRINTCEETNIKLLRDIEDLEGSNVKPLSSLQEENGFLNNRIKTCEETNEKLLRDIQDLEESRVKQLSLLQEEIGFLENKIQTCEETNDNLLKDTQDLEERHVRELSRLQEENDNLKTPQSERCKEIITMLEEDNTKLQNEIDRLSDEITNLQNQITDKSTKLEEIEKERDLLLLKGASDNENKMIQEMEDHNASLRQHADKMEQENEIFKNEVKNLISNIGRLEKDSLAQQHQVESLINENEQLKSKIAGLETELSALRQSTQTDVNEVCSAMQTTINELGQQLKIEEEHVKELTNALDQCNHQQQDNEALLNVIKSLKEENSKFKANERRSSKSSKFSVDEDKTSLSAVQKSSIVEERLTDGSKYSVVHSKEPRSRTASSSRDGSKSSVIHAKDPESSKRSSRSVSTSSREHRRSSSSKDGTKEKEPPSVVYKKISLDPQHMVKRNRESLTKSKPVSTSTSGHVRRSSEKSQYGPNQCKCSDVAVKGDDGGYSCVKTVNGMTVQVDVTQDRNKILQYNENLKKKLNSEATCECHRSMRHMLTEVIVVSKPGRREKHSRSCNCCLCPKETDKANNIDDVET